MRLLRLPGWILLLAAFAAAAAEVLVPPPSGAPEIFVPARDLWYTAWPGSMIFVQIRLERLAPILWDPLLIGLLSLPGWFLLGLPGVVLTWLSRPRGYADRRERAEVRKYEEAMLLYDDLAREARNQGLDREGDDMSPDHSGHDTLDEIWRQSEVDDDDLFSMKRAEALRAEIEARQKNIAIENQVSADDQPAPESKDEPSGTG